jgi:hypothetical protein
VLAHDVAGLLSKGRRSRAQLGAALEKVVLLTPAATVCHACALTIIVRRILIEQLPLFNVSAMRARAGTNGCSCERPKRFRFIFACCAKHMGIDCCALSDTRSCRTSSSYLFGAVLFMSRCEYVSCASRTKGNSQSPRDMQTVTLVLAGTNRQNERADAGGYKWRRHFCSDERQGSKQGSRVQS